MNKPLCLVDLDGVLLPFKEGSKINQFFTILPVRAGFNVYVNKLNIERMKKLSESFDLIWASMWQEDCNLVIGPYHGLYDLPFIKFGNCPPWRGEYLDEFNQFFDETPGTYKLPDVSAYVKDKHFAWIDDHIEDDAFEWARQRSSQGSDTLLIRTDPYVGLTDDHVETLLKFAEERRND